MSIGQKQGDLNARVRDYLREHNFRPGDQLPNERELAAFMGVGRTALRPVLKSLESQGIIVRRPQAGTFLEAIPAPHVKQARVVVIAPLSNTRQKGRETDPAWLHQVISAFERVVLPSGVQLQLKDQSPHIANPCSIKEMSCEAANEGAQAAVLLHPLASREKTSCALSLLHDRGVHPIIVSSRTYPGLASQVYFDSGWGAYLATRHLLQLGHERVAFAGAPGGHEWVQERIQGYYQALDVAEMKRQPTWVWKPDNTERLPTTQDGTQALEYFLSLPEKKRPTAFVAANDVIALGILKEARKRRVKIPEQFSLIGFDNDSGALLNGLTTIERPTETLGEAIARVTLERLAAGANADTVTHRLRPLLIERSTTKSLLRNSKGGTEVT